MEVRETSPGARAESPFADVRTPRLSIWHLMLWAFCTAAHLSLLRALYDTPNGFASFQHPDAVLEVMSAGAALMGAFVLVQSRRRSGRPMLRQPGHWLLFVSAFFNILLYPVLIIFPLLRRTFVEEERLLLMCVGAIYLCPAIAYGFAAFHNSALRWKAIFITLVLSNLSQYLVYIEIALGGYGITLWQRTSPAIGSLAYVMAAVLLIAVAVSDLLTAGRRYDWLHWMGVAALVGPTFYEMLHLIGYWFLR